MKILPTIFLICAVFSVLFFFAQYIRIRKWDVLANVAENETAPGLFPRRAYPMRRTDILPLTLIVLLYSVTAFFGLGDRAAPETFCSFSESGRYAVAVLPEDTLVSRVAYYTGLHTGNYYLQFSLDGEEYTDEATMTQGYNDLFKWREAQLLNPAMQVKYVRIIADARLDMGELAIYDGWGELIPASSMTFDAGSAPLFDEQGLIPERFTYKNSAYFDEIYHVRTAQEHLTDVYPYEVSHPPLGKIIIGIGIQLFGLNPFGWRFMGVLFGILMLPVLYILIKNMFGSTAISACGTAIFAFDFMHFTQTRIATIDTYGVFFIMLMFLFMYRFITAPRDDPEIPKWKSTLPLMLSGLCFGLGAASKWTVIYGGAGLAIVWLLFRIGRGRDMQKTGRGEEHINELVSNIWECMLFFVAIPCVIYYVSYWFYGTAQGYSGIEMLFKPEYAGTVLRNQEFMFTYHQGVSASHPYSSSWYQWLFNARPILYYLESLPNNMKSAFACFANPLVVWGGLFAMITIFYRAIRYRDSLAIFILIGYLSSLVPWMFITRITFAYHYFPCIVFLVLAICHVFNSIRISTPKWRGMVYTATGVCVSLFFVFYPVLTGVVAPRWYTDMLAWIPDAWPF